MSAPPNHNPETSLLQGGTAPITPMAGGGSEGVPPGYDPDASALPVLGGSSDSHIQPLKGGATTLADAFTKIASRDTPLSSGLQSIAKIQTNTTTLKSGLQMAKVDPLGALTEVALTSLTKPSAPIVEPVAPSGSASVTADPPPLTALQAQKQQSDAIQQAAIKAALQTVAKKEAVNRMIAEGKSTPSNVKLHTEIQGSHKAFDDLEKEIKKVSNNASLMAAFKRARDAKRHSDIQSIESIGTLRAIEQMPASNGTFVPGNFIMAPSRELFRKVNYEPVTLDSRLFHIRKPDEAGYVQGDWVDGKYTKDEASFLNAMNLTKSMMAELFGETWTESLAIFLRGITTTSCYTDVNLITKSDCQTVRYFLEKIYYWFLQHPLAGA